MSTSTSSSIGTGVGIAALTRRRAWAVALVATLTMTMSYVDRQTLSVLAPIVTRELGLSEQAYGWLASAFSIAYLTGAPLAGRWIDRVGARRGLPAAVLTWSAVAALHALVPGFAALFALRILLGLAEAPSFPGAAQTVQRALPPAERARGFGVLFTGSSVGAMIAPPLATLLARTVHWRAAFVGTALFGLLWLPLWRWATSAPDARAALDRAHSETAREKAPPVGSVITSPAVLRCVALVLASAPVTGFVLLWGAKLFVRQYGVEPIAVGKYLWLPPLFFDLGAVLFGDAASRRARAGGDDRPHNSLVALAGLLTASVALMAFAPTPWTAVAAASLAMAGASAMYALGTSDMLARLPPGAVSLAGGVGAAAQSLAYIVLNPLVGRVVEQTGSYRSVLLALGLWVLPGWALWLAWRPPPAHAPSYPAG